MAGVPEHTVVGTVIMFPMIAVEQVLHTTSVALLGLRIYQAMHWVSDSLPALSLAVGAVWLAGAVAKRLALDASPGCPG